MRNGRKGEYPDLPFCVVVWLPSYMTEPHLEIGAAFPDSPAIARTGRLLEASPYFHLGVCI